MAWEDGRFSRFLKLDREQSKYYICDDDLSKIFWAKHLRFPLTIHQLTSDLQKLFLSRISDQEETLYANLQRAKDDTKEYLFEMIRSFAGKEEEIESDWKRGRTGSSRQFLSVVLSYLQHDPATVWIDETGSISPHGRKYKSLYHIFTVEENGIDFDFSASQAKRSRRFVKWEDMDFLSKLGIHFDAEQLKDIPLPTWFGASAGITGHIEALLSEMVISASPKASQSHEQINPANADKAEGSSTIEDVESSFTVVDGLKERND
ncbi:hypothetical protein EPUS_05334 [Endocarpon pusillum Z07020]|uniref:Uncharacterized protein n=1 Tax=Endocarpon pusillum (strain Z07020 / HMAS-L-300199) TaxID=1263415 RepID=U1G1Z4_ENDPU|nr:uncharacterized protein EPUS_05334 [Endocarpon pusillum Z07020]ERF71282.1 hypothetical protein EPUS_05334 [Endocarpon pusillum Z07020]